jgi:AraC family transcriptional regulator
VLEHCERSPAIEEKQEREMTQPKMEKALVTQSSVPRVENGKSLLIAGLRSHYAPMEMGNIPAQWQRFVAHFGKIPGQVGRVAYGLSFNIDSPAGVDYLSGVEVSSTSGLPNDFSVVTVPVQKYAVFSHSGHVSTIFQTCDAIGREWLTASGHEAARQTGDGPDFFERYGEEFNPQTGMGGMEVWVPIK